MPRWSAASASAPTELTRLNAELHRAKAEADDANVSKTRFIAAASHDILQPLNAARLYVTSLIERQRAGEDGDLVANIDASLEAVEEIFGALLDISRLDTGAMKPEFSDFRIDELLQRLEVEFSPLAAEKGLDLTSCRVRFTCAPIAGCSGRLLQNLVSNAIKYTPAGRVLVGCRRRGAQLRIDVCDTGIGIPHAKRRAVFEEFHRLDQGARVARGVGLGPVDRRAHRPRARHRDFAAIGARPRFAFFRRRAALGRQLSRGSVAHPCRADRCRTARRHGRALHRQRARHSRRHGDAARRLGLPRAQGRGPRRGVRGDGGSGVEPDGLLVDYHLDGGNGVAAIAELRRRLQRHIPAIVITADRSAHVREEAAGEAAHLLNKPIKPASLRALITQWQVQRVAAE